MDKNKTNIMRRIKRQVTPGSNNFIPRHKLDRRNSENIKLLAIISHDVLSPLNSIEGYLSVLSDCELSPDERCAMEKELLLLTHGTKAMLSNLLVWSNTQLNGIKPNIQSVKITDVLMDLLSVKTSIATKKGINIIVQLDDALEAMVDSNLLQIVIRNLVSNAIKFTKPGGSISVQGSICQDKCILAVQDTGIGIPKYMQSQIFSVKQTTNGTMNEKGTGLGLLLCREFVELQKGMIWFDSSERGTTFYLSFPINFRISSKSNA